MSMRAADNGFDWYCARLRGISAVFFYLWQKMKKLDFLRNFVIILVLYNIKFKDIPNEQAHQTA